MNPLEFLRSFVGKATANNIPSNRFSEVVSDQIEKYSSAYEVELIRQRAVRKYSRRWESPKRKRQRLRDLGRVLAMRPGDLVYMHQNGHVTTCGASSLDGQYRTVREPTIKDEV